MKHKCWLAVALAIGLASCATTGGNPDEKVALSSGAKPETKAAITAAETANSAAVAAGYEWFWKDKPASKHLQDAIKAANSGDDKAAIKLAKEVESAGIQGQAQAEAAKTAAPRFAKASVVSTAPADKKAAKAESKTETKAAKTETPAAKPSGNGSKIYKNTCSSCHDSGVAGSPKLGDKAAWSPRIAAGKLYANALNGIRAMPAKGGNASLSDADVKAAVDYMAAQGK